MTSENKDVPGGDLTDHGADPQERDEGQPSSGTTPAADGAPEVDPDEPGGQLTDHGADPSER